MNGDSVNLNELTPVSGKANKLVVLLHGYGSDGKDLIALAPILSQTLPDAYFISPNAPFPCEIEGSTGYQWFSLYGPEGTNRAEGMAKVLPIITDLIGYKLDALHLSWSDVILIGFSQGAMVSMTLALESPGEVMGVVAFSGMLVEG
jgi:phospholipase/carboxylesterase